MTQPYGGIAGGIVSIRDDNNPSFANMKRSGMLDTLSATYQPKKLLARSENSAALRVAMVIRIAMCPAPSRQTFLQMPDEAS